MQQRSSVTIQEVVDYLNELMELDRVAVGALINNRVPCNQALAEHPTCQVRAQDGGHVVGLLGILNGMFGVDGEGWGALAIAFSPTDAKRAVNRWSTVPPQGPTVGLFLQEQ